MANEFKIKKGLIVTGASGGTVVDIQGSQGQLFSVTDNLSGSIFAVSDISGVPILDVNSSGLSTFDGDVNLPDSKKILLGTGNDFQLYHDGTHGVLNNTTGNLYTSALGSLMFRTSLNVTALTLDTSQNATFAGVVSINGGNLDLNGTAPIMKVDSSNAASGLRLNVTGLDSDADLLYRLQAAGTTVFTVLRGGNSTFSEQAFSAATSSGDASSTLTTKGYVDGLITGATIYRGAWDPSGGGYGSPDLSGVTQTSGYYYICSADGTAEPNGTGTEPDTWAVGDWVIYNDVSGTGQWQKIDNSSVLSGAGTGQTVALWEGPSSVTDSETLGNSIITQQSDDEISILSTNATTGQNGKLTIYSYDDGDTDVKNLQLTVNNGGDANITNTGPYLNLTALNYIKSNNVHIFNQDTFMYYGKYIRFLDATSPQDSWNRTLGVSASDVVQVGGIAGYNTGKGQLALFSNNAQAMFIDEDQRVQFNAYDSTNNTGTPTYLLGTDASGNVVKTNTVPGSGAGPYLPLSAGSSYPLTGTLYLGNVGGDQKIQFQRTGGNVYSIEHDSAQLYFYNRTTTESPLVIQNDGDVLMNAGNVGIGTTSPSAKLEVNVGVNSLKISGRDTYIDSSIDSANANIYVTQAGVGDFSQLAGSLVLQARTQGTVYRDIIFAGGLTSGNALMTITGDGNVGIGTTSPVAKLHVDDSVGGKLRLSNISATADGEKIGGIETGVANGTFFAGINFFRHDANDGEIRFRTKVNNTNTDVMTIVDGNVGIGVTNPNTKLHVGGIIQVTESSNTAFYGGNYVRLFGDQNYGFRNTGGTYVANISMSGNSYFNGGNVGIGTTSPAAKLHVDSSTAFSLTSVAGDTLFLSDDTNPSALNGVGASIGFSGPQAVQRQAAIAALRTGADHDFIGLAFYKHPGTSNDETIVEQMRITDSGNVGIGTSTPNAKLDIQGTQGQLFSVTDDLSGSIFAVADISGVPIFDVNSSGVSYFDGNVGIGTTNPSARLEVAASATTSVDIAHFSNSNDVVKIKHALDGLGSGITSIFDASNNEDIRLSAQSNSWFNAGNVGIGTTSPNAKLNVDGGIKIEGTNSLSFGGTASVPAWGINSSGNDLIINDQATTVGDVLLTNAGNVGIGTTSPSYKLDVSGNGRFTSTVTAANFILSSDERLKENIEKACDNRIKADWKTFELKTDKGQKRYGVIAQELEKTNPEFVREDTQGFKSVAYIDLLIAKIAELEARLEKAGI